MLASPPNFGVKLMRPSFGSAAELPAVSPARWRHGGCRLPLGALHVIGGNRRAARASVRGTGRTAYTKDVGRTNHSFRVCALSMKLRVPGRSVPCRGGCRELSGHCSDVWRQRAREGRHNRREWTVSARDESAEAVLHFPFALALHAERKGHDASEADRG